MIGQTIFLEWLAKQMAELDRKAGATRDYDSAHMAGWIPSMIENHDEGIRLAEELRTVIVRPASLTFTPRAAKGRPATSCRPGRRATIAPRTGLHDTRLRPEDAAGDRGLV